MAAQHDDSAQKRKHADHHYDQQRCVDERRLTTETSPQGQGRSYAREDTPPAQCSVLCGPRSCSTLPSSLGGGHNDHGTSPPEPKRRRLWGLRGLVKMFRRHVRRKGGADTPGSPEGVAPTLRARSASELAVDPANRSSGGPYNQGLSVSHDSVFSPESPPDQGTTSPPGLALATRGVNMVGNMSELKAALRRRRGLDSGSTEDDPDDPGLPRSPGHGSPTTLDVLNHGLKNSSRGAQSSCSDGSLLSMGSSENDEDSFGVLSRHSSKHSLIEGSRQVVDTEPALGAAPLSHNAARHKISVRPKRSHGIPRARKQSQVAASSLPTTPEVNEDIRNGVSPLNPSVKPPQRIQDPNQRPASISFSNIESQFMQWTDVPGSSEHPKSLPKQAIARDFVNDSSRNLPAGNVGAYGEVRASRDKRKDPFKAPVAVKSGRQKSDPAKLLYMRESEYVQDKSSRSSSVEGRLEGNLEEKNYRVDYEARDESIRYQQCVDGVTNVQIGKATEGRADLVPSATIHPIESQERGFSATKSFSPGRLSSSYDCLDSEGINVEPIPMNPRISSLESCEAKSSTDSLTTTPLPGIYIRSNQSVVKTKRSSVHVQHTSESMVRAREEPEQSFIEKQTSLTSQATSIMDRNHYARHDMHNIDGDSHNSGPLSLDSSLNFVQHDHIRKYTSVEEINAKKRISDGGISHTRFVDEQLNIRRHEQRESQASQINQYREQPTTTQQSVSISRSVSVHAPASSPKDVGNRSRKSSVGDELESDGSLPKVSLRRVKREPSQKKPEEKVSTAVPEFMRIQLNRVQNKANTVIFNTEQSGDGQTSSNNAESDEIAQQQFDKLQVNEGSEKPRDNSEIIVQDHPKFEQNIKEDYIHSQIGISSEQSITAPVVQSEPSISSPSTLPSYTPVRSASPPSQSTLQREDSRELRNKDEIILRRPSVVDRAIVIDQTMGTPTPKRPGDQPELMKVFARRSFKQKDVDLDPTGEEQISDVDKENHIPLSTKIATQEEQNNLQNNSFRKNERINSSIIAPVKNISNITAKRYSLGGMSSPTPSTAQTKPTVIVLSGNNSPLVDTPDKMHDGHLQSSLKQKEKGISAPSYGRSHSVSPASSDLCDMSGSDDGSEKGQVTPVASLNNRVKKGSSFSARVTPKPQVPNTISPLVNPLSRTRTTDSQSPTEIDSRVSTSKDIKENESPVSSFNSAIIKRSVQPTLTPVDSVYSSYPSSENSTIERNSSPSNTAVGIQGKRSSRGQAVMWPPRNQSMESSPKESSPIESSIKDSHKESLPEKSPQSDHGTYPLPPSKIVSTFKESFSSADGSESQSSSNEEEFSQKTPKTHKIGEPANKSVKSPKGLVLAEARNISFTHSFESHSSASPATPSHGFMNRGNDTPVKSERRVSVGEPSNAVNTEDWRVLVRQRREDRIKLTKTPDAEEIIMENRPSVSRNSKVLEMANNFQKLQVA